VINLDEPDEYIDFMAKYKDWISIKRIGIRENTRPEEVVFYLAGIRTTIDSKSYPMLNIKTSLLDAYAQKVCQGSKKNYESLASALQKLGTPDAKKVISEASSKEFAPLAETYLLGKVITTIGYDASINQTQISKIFPDLKVKKPLGRSKSSKVEE
jgi:hypothetical protein